MSQRLLAQRIQQRALQLAKPITLTERETMDILTIAREEIMHLVYEEGEFQYDGMGKYHMSKRSARPGRNPQTGAVIQIPETVTVGFRPSAAFKRLLAGERLSNGTAQKREKTVVATGKTKAKGTATGRKARAAVG